MILEESAPNLETLLRGDDETFVNNVYKTLLRRAPDQDGLSNYLSQLQHGVSRENMVTDIAASEEARLVGARLTGLENLTTARKADNARKGIMGWFSKNH